MNVADIAACIEGLAPVGFAYDWDRVGLRIGDPTTKVKRVLVALTLTPAAWAAARKRNVHLIVTHHPPMWEPLSTLRTDHPETRLWLEIAQSGVACYTAHTNLDVAPGGVNDVLAERLGVEDTRPLFPVAQGSFVKLVTFVPDRHLAVVRQAVCDTGAGKIGEYAQCSFSSEGTGTFLPSEKAKPFSGKRHVVNEESERRLEILVQAARLSDAIEGLNSAHPYDEVAYDIYPIKNADASIGIGLAGHLPKSVSLADFSKSVRAALNVQHIRAVGKAKQRIKTVAVMGGAGGGQIPHVPEGIDAFVTGDVKYHEAQSALDRGLAVIDGGHHGTEKWIVGHLAAYLRRELKSLNVSTYMEPDPFLAVVE